MGDFVNLWPGWIGLHSEDLGVALAARKNGDELLFASKDSGTPLRWIPSGEFVLHPKVIQTPEDVQGQVGH